MSQLAALTVLDETANFAAGTIAFNTALIKSTFPRDKGIYTTAETTRFTYNKSYYQTIPVTVYVSETELNVQHIMGRAFITGVNLPLNVNYINGESVSLYSYTFILDYVVYAMSDPSNTDQTIVVYDQNVGTPTQFTVAHNLAYILAMANSDSNYIIGDGIRKITVAATQPTNPTYGDWWLNTA